MSNELKIKAAEIVAAYVSHHPLPPAEVPRFLRQMIEAITRGNEPPEEQSAEPTAVEPAEVPPVSISESVQHDYLVCLEDGKRMTMLKRHLRTHFDMSPAEYRAKWKLPADYPMVCPAYSEARRSIAIKNGLGQS
jgi:predicted transcriptional regulator